MRKAGILHCYKCKGKTPLSKKTLDEWFSNTLSPSLGCKHCGNKKGNSVEDFQTNVMLGRLLNF